MKQSLRWITLAGTLFFLGKALHDHWLEITSIHIDPSGWAILAVATGITLLAHIWAAWIWTWVLRDLNQTVSPAKFIQVYLKTNIAKYLPGNIWHFYGRILAAKSAKIPSEIATLSVLLEPLLMGASALIFIVLFGNLFFTNQINIFIRLLQFISLLFLCLALHPLCLNPLLRFLSKLKNRKPNSPTLSVTYFNVERYPLVPLLGELGFLGLRGMGFILTIFALNSVSLSQVPLLLGAFSFAWLLGLVVPLAPGGLGIFEATTLAILQYHFPSALLISAIALYRVVSILAETAGASLAWLDEKLIGTHSSF
jgi:uncharacterized membrane protein YbhN (UPF0104 family)